MPTSDERSLESLAQDILPALIARLGASDLGELEVSTDAWRVRLRRAPRVALPAGSGGAVDSDVGDDGPLTARSPGVGYFEPHASLAVGQTVRAGDRLGSVDILGIPQDVLAPADGTIGRVYAQPGQAVEYGEALASIGAGVDDVESGAGSVSD